MYFFHLPLGSGTGTLGCSSLPLWIRTVAHYIYIYIKMMFILYLIYWITGLPLSFKLTRNHILCFQVPPGLWQESGCRPQWPPERGQTWLGAWWETGPRTSRHGRARQPHTTCPPSSLSAEAATAEVTSSSASREAPSQKKETRVDWKLEIMMI